MKILVCNDDGYLSRGIVALSEALSGIADVTVVAPDRNHSGASNSLTLHSPLRVHKVEEKRYFVNGTPSDCVHLALSGFLDEEPDIVVSGINHGANLGDDVIYSGTVAAAMEGRSWGCRPSPSRWSAGTPSTSIPPRVSPATWCAACRTTRCRMTSC